MSARILVVDDIEANVRLLEAKLAAEYYEVSTAMDGQTALAMAQRDPPDIILLDVMMPGIDGFTVCRKLKEDPATRHIPVVMITALDGRADRIQGLEAGASDFLTKPIDDVMLFARVRSLTRFKLVIDELRQRERQKRFWERLRLAAAGLLALHQLPLDHHLRRDARMVGARLPQHVAAAHALEAAQDVLQRVVERVPHVQRAGHVRRRDHDGEGIGVAAVGTAGGERAGILPDQGHTTFEVGGLIILFDHDISAGAEPAVQFGMSRNLFPVFDRDLKKLAQAVGAWALFGLTSGRGRRSRRGLLDRPGRVSA